MSRLIVKNLPPYITPTQLQEHFQQKGNPGGTITDVKVSQKSDGTSRRFGFVGYKSEQEALAAQKWFHHTFIGSTRISVNFSEGTKDVPAPRPNKRRRLDVSTEPDPRPSLRKVSPEHNPKKNDGRLENFLEVMQPQKVPAWANEPSVQPSNIEKFNDTEEVKLHDLSDMEWMRQRMSQHVDQENDVEQSDTESPQGNKLPQRQDEPAEPTDANKETIIRTSRLFIRNLAFSCTDEELTELFKPFGEISQVHTPLDPVTKHRKGVAYVTFAQPSNALAAYEALDKKSFQGRLIHILGAVDKQGKVEAEGRKKGLKDEKAAKRKAAAGKEFNWSMLYMNSDAVASSIAARMDISKSDILNPDSGSNPAVKLALAETHIIQETKSYLEGQGVLLSAFSSPARSRTTILVKNIPYGTTEDQIRELFEPYGTLNRVLVPPSGTMAVVDYDQPDDAAKGFRAVAYKRLGNSIIYLERGPLGMFDENSSPTSEALKHSATSAHVVRLSAQDWNNAQPDEEEPSIRSGTALFIKNLSFSTTQEKFTKIFNSLPSFSFARIQTKPDPNRPDRRLSMGYGFVGFKDVDSAKSAMKSMQGFALDGHALHVSFAGRGADDERPQGQDSKTTNKSWTTKMIVKNVPFEATKKDIRDLFGTHGHLKSVRLPKRFDTRSRGFAFLEFVSRHEAENAYAALRHTHLLGRHLVLEWAEEGEQDLDALRKKAGVGYGGGKDMPGRKRKLDLGTTTEDADDLM